MAVRPKNLSPFPAAERHDPQMTLQPQPPLPHCPSFEWTIFDSLESVLNVQVIDEKTGRNVDLTGWGMALTIRRRIDETAVIDIDESVAGISLVGTGVFRIALQPVVHTGQLSVGAYPTLRPAEYEVFIYDVELTPDDWPLDTTPRPFIGFGGQIRAMRDARP